MGNQWRNEIVNRGIAEKVLSLVDRGLVCGIGDPRPGAMCVEAAVCYALGEPHGDHPSCVDNDLVLFKIILNDSKWSSIMARARGMRRLALVQLGSAGNLDRNAFSRGLAKLALDWVNGIESPSTQNMEALGIFSQACGQAGQANRYDLPWAKVEYAAYVARNVGDFVFQINGHEARDRALAGCAEDVVQLLVRMGVPGAEWLELAPLES